MATESVEIIIEADNRASAKFKQVNKDMEASVKNIREVGGKAKASTELVGTLANTLGSSGIGGFAGEIAQLTERVSAFSEVSKDGGKGAFAFRAGLAAAVGVIGFKFGQVIGNAIFQTERWNKELEKSIVRNREIANELEGRRGGAFDEQIAAIREIEDLEQRRKAANEAQLEIAKNMATPERMLANLKAEIAERENAYLHSTMLISGEYKGHHEILKAQAAELESRISAEQKRKQQLLEIAVGEQDNLALQKEQAEQQRQRAEQSQGFLQKLRDEIELLKASKAEQIAIEAARNTTKADRGDAERLLAERDALLAKQQAEKAAQDATKRAAEERKREQEAEAKRMQTVRQGIVEKLRHEAIALKDGAIAAKAYQLELQGFDTASAQRIAQVQALLGEKQGQEINVGVQATQSRLLTTGRAENIASKTEQNTAQTAKQLRRLADFLERQQPQTIELQRGNV